MSEAAAAVCLERRPENAAALVSLGRYATGGDATSLTGANGEGRTLRRLLKTVVPSSGVDLVHAHGTGTILNDAIELAALAAGLPDGGSNSTLYSHKAALGHSLGASGLVSAVLNVIAHRRAAVPPNRNTVIALPTAMRLNAAPVRTPIRRSLCIAAGFGGAVTVVGMNS